MSSVGVILAVATAAAVAATVVAAADTYETDSLLDVVC